jgi:hypothetical protein
MDPRRRGDDAQRVEKTKNCSIRFGVGVLLYLFMGSTVVALDRFCGTVNRAGFQGFYLCFAKRF